MDLDDPYIDLGWWAMSGRNLMEALQRAHNGEDPDLIYAELYANSRTEIPPVAE